MLKDQNVERYVKERIEPLQEQIKELQNTISKLMQVNNLHLQNVSGSVLENDINPFDLPDYCKKRGGCNHSNRVCYNPTMHCYLDSRKGDWIVDTESTCEHKNKESWGPDADRCIDCGLTWDV